MELKYMRKKFCLRKHKVPIERILVYNVIKNWWNMAYTVCHAAIPVHHRPVTIATRE